MAKPNKSPEASPEQAPEPTVQTTVVSEAKPSEDQTKTPQYDNLSDRTRAELAAGKRIVDSMPRSDVQRAAEIPDQVFLDAESDALKRDFVERIMASRANAAPKPYVIPEPPPQILAMRKLEMEAGKKAVEAHAVADAERAPIIAARKPDPGEQRNIPVFRPENYVPDPMKGKGVLKGMSIDVP